MIRRMFSGRLGRLEYWKATILSYLLMLVPALFIAAATGFIFAFEMSDLMMGILLGVIVVCAMVPLLFLTIAGLGITVRRLHDLGLSGWLAALLIGASLMATVLGVDWSQEDLPSKPWLMWFDIAFWMTFLALGFWPARTDSNQYGDRTRYGSWWGALVGKRKVEV